MGDAAPGHDDGAMDDEEPREPTDDAGLHAPERPGMGDTHPQPILRFDPREHVTLLVGIVRWTVAGVAVGALAGGAVYVFLRALIRATDTRLDHPNLLFALPLAGFAVGASYHYLGGRSGGGNTLLIDEIHEPRAWLPRRMAPLVLVATVVGHLFGASIGREGTAIQMAGSLTDAAARLLRIGPADRRILLIASIAGGFGAVFGVPLAGTVFALEVQSVGRVRFDALVPALAASITGDLVVRGLGMHHERLPHLAPFSVDAPLLAKCAVAGIAFGLTAIVFADLTHALKQVTARFLSWPPIRPFVGGLVLLVLVGIVRDRAYLGLSSPLVVAALAGGSGVAAGAFALKLLFTSLSLGTGFQGGEVTPLFVMGATLGVPLAHLLHSPVGLMAAVGFVAVFAGASNTPLACTILAVEVFGSAIAVPAAVACVVSFVVSTDRGIYGSRRIDVGPA
jgi:H+/Cl- antiporter ClcA